MDLKLGDSALNSILLPVVIDERLLYEEGCETSVPLIVSVKSNGCVHGAHETEITTEHPEVSEFVHFGNETTIAAVEEISDGERKQEIESAIEEINSAHIRLPDYERCCYKVRKDRRKRHWSDEWQNEQSDKCVNSRSAHRKPKKRLFAHRLQWSNDSMENAMSDVREQNMTLRGAAKKNNVPYSTLKDRIQGRVMHGTKPGVKTVLSPEEENDLMLCIQQMETGGFPLHCTNIRELARQMLMMRVARGFSMPYHDGCPGHNWLTGFLKRHPGIHLRRSLNRNAVLSASKQKQILKRFFEITSHVYKKNRLLQKPESIFVVTEMKIATYPGASAYIACNARGTPLAPFVVFHNDPVDAARLTAYSLPEFKDALFFNARGTHDGDALFVWFRDHFMQYRTSYHGRSVILFVGCPVSEISLRFIQLAEEEHVALISLPSAVAHLVHPLISGILHSLNADISSGIEQLITDGKLAAGSPLSHSLLAMLLAELWADKWPCDDVRKSFASCGIFPLNIRAITAERISATTGDNVNDNCITSESGEDVDEDVAHGLNLLSELSTLEQQKESCSDPQRRHKNMKLNISKTVDGGSAYASVGSLHDHLQLHGPEVSGEVVTCFIGEEKDNEAAEHACADMSSSVFCQPCICTKVSPRNECDQFCHTESSVIVGEKHSVPTYTQRLISDSDRVKLKLYQ